MKESENSLRNFKRPNIHILEFPEGEKRGKEAENFPGLVKELDI